MFQAEAANRCPNCFLVASEESVRMSTLVEARAEQVSDRLIEHLRNSLCIAEPLERQTDLVMVGALDSLMIIDLVTYVETAFGVHVQPSEVTPQNFRSVESLTHLITEKLAEQQPGRTSAREAD